MADTTARVTESQGDLPTTTATLSIAFFRDRPHQPGSRHLLLGLRRVLIGRGRGTTRRTTEDRIATLRLDLDDTRISSPHIEIELHQRAWIITDLGSTNGTRINGDALVAHQSRTLEDGDLIEVGATFLVFRGEQLAWLAGGRDEADIRLHDPLDLSGADLPIHPGWPTFHLPLAHTYREAARNAPSRLPVLILGPTGTGKERLARGIHTLSRRRGPLVDLNCAAFSDQMIDSELFGHKRGAFTGADRDRPGLIRTSSGGTLFLDELADLPATAQTRLLRVLEEGKVRPIGSDEAYSADLRIVAATSQDLDMKGFREDLRYRIAGVTLVLPPLHQRREDLGLMIAEILGSRPISFAPDAARALLLHPWPGGARALRQTLDRLVTLAATRPDQRIHRIDLGFDAPVVRDLPESKTVSVVPGAITRDQVEAALRATGGSVTQTAVRLGCHRSHADRLIKKFDLDPAAYRPR